ncbi:MAG: head completion protein, partial [Betaproteobacteria bacterium]|nr:head completion protein [Betaproteobacteria bacterium]
DTHPDVMQWASEEFCIPYRSPIDGRVHRYFPDFWIKQRDKHGNIDIKVIEVKPLAQTKPPVPQTRKTKRYINEVVTWGINEAKWNAAKKFCDTKGWKFVVMTEKELGIK